MENAAFIRRRAHSDKDKLWHQSAYYVDTMLAKYMISRPIYTKTQGDGDEISVLAGVSRENSAEIIIRAVNTTDKCASLQVELADTRKMRVLGGLKLEGNLTAYNTFDAPRAISPQPIAAGAELRLSPFSFTVFECVAE